MSWLQKLSLRLRALFRKSRMEQELDEELRFHLDRQIEENIKSGMSPEEARYRALRAFGGVEQVKEACRDMRGVAFIETLIRDLRYGFRVLRRSPGFTTVAVLSLALGIGANTAIFSVIDAVLLKMLPVKGPKQLVQLELVHQGKGFNYFSYPVFEQLRDHTEVFSDLFAWRIQRFNLGLGSEIEPVDGMFVTGNYYTALGVHASLGRTLVQEDDGLAGGAPSLVAVISDHCWERHFGRDPGVLGRTVMLEGVPLTIVGVTPGNFYGTEVGKSPEIAIPLTLQPQLNPDRPFLRRPDAQWMRIMARLKPGVSEEQARVRLQVLWPQIVAEVDRQGRSGFGTLGLTLTSASTGLSALRDQFSRPLFVLMGVVALVLLIACANIANLLLARATARQKEIAVRLAIGASRLRVIRQLLTESVLLATLGAAVGLLVAVWGSRLLVHLLSTRRMPISLDLQLDWRVLGFTGIVAVLTGGLFGLAPAFRATRVSLGSALKEGARTLTGGGARWSLGKALVVSQVALSLLLLAGAGLFVRSLQKLLTLDLGFRREGVLLVSLNARRAGYQGTALANLYRQLLERINALPGVRAVSLSVYPPLTGGGGIFFSAASVLAEGYTAQFSGPGNVYLNIVSPRFFETLGTPLLQGRDFGPQDMETAPRVAIVSEAFARHYFPQGSPLGRHIQIGSAAMEVVGVVKDAKYETLREPPHRTVYVPYLQNLSASSTAITLEVRGTGDLASVATAVRHELQGLGKQLPADISTLTERVDQALLQERLIATLASFFGLLALLLACVGLYGMMAYAVVRRTNEIGIRMALGAQPRDVLWLVLREAVLLVLIGVAIGVPAALASTRLVSSFLFGLTPNDPVTIAMATLLLVTVAVFASYLPARCASRVDPMVALRHE